MRKPAVVRVQTLELHALDGSGAGCDAECRRQQNGENRAYEKGYMFHKIIESLYIVTMSQCAKALHDANIAIKSLHFPAFFALVRLFYPLVCLFSEVGECFFKFAFVIFRFVDLNHS